MKSDEEKKQIRLLWNICFNDTEEFKDFYFSEIYDNNIVTTIEKNGQIISAIQSIPEILSFGQQQISVGYIYGACTHPSYRRKGYMATLLSEIQEKMLLKDYAISLLVPESQELFNYYSKFGYSTCFYQKKVYNATNLLKSSDKSIKEIRTEDSIHTFEEFYKSRQKEENCRILHIDNHYERMRKELSTDNGKCLAAISESNRLVAITFVTESAEEKEMVIKECLGLEDYDTLFYGFLKARNDGKGWRTIWLRPSTISDKDATPYAMARIINLEKTLRLWAKQNKHLKKLIHIEDDKLLPINNGNFLLIDGKCTRCEENKEAKTYTIASLTKEILVENNAKASLMMD